MLKETSGLELKEISFLQREFSVSLTCHLLEFLNDASILNSSRVLIDT